MLIKVVKLGKRNKPPIWLDTRRACDTEIFCGHFKKYILLQIYSWPKAFPPAF